MESVRVGSRDLLPRKVVAVGTCLQLARRLGLLLRGLLLSTLSVEVLQTKLRVVVLLLLQLLRKMSVMRLGLMMNRYLLLCLGLDGLRGEGGCGLLWLAV